MSGRGARASLALQPTIANGLSRSRACAQTPRYAPPTLCGPLFATTLSAWKTLTRSA